MLFCGFCSFISLGLIFWFLIWILQTRFISITGTGDAGTGDSNSFFLIRAVGNDDFKISERVILNFIGRAVAD